MHYLIILGIMMLLFGPVRGLGIAIGTFMGVLLIMHPVNAIWIIPVTLLGYSLSRQ